MIKVDCSRCVSNGAISAFKHVQGGVCFKCKGAGFVMQKTNPRPSKTFNVFQKWTDPESCNYNEGDFIFVSTIKASSQAEADRKLKKRLEHTGREFYAEESK